MLIRMKSVDHPIPNGSKILVRMEGADNGNMSWDRHEVDDVWREVPKNTVGIVCGSDYLGEVQGTGYDVYFPESEVLNVLDEKDFSEDPDDFLLMEFGKGGRLEEDGPNNYRDPKVVAEIAERAGLDADRYDVQDISKFPTLSSLCEEAGITHVVENEAEQLHRFLRHNDELFIVSTDWLSNLEKDLAGSADKRARLLDKFQGYDPFEGRFMVPEITDMMIWIEADTSDGIVFIHPDVLALSIDEVEEVGNYLDSGDDHTPKPDCWAALLEALPGRLYEIELTAGHGARMSAPGYLDCTDWSVHETREEAMEELVRLFGDDDAPRP